MEEQVVCPWCLTEIVWDEEIGPEKHCPHCENELDGYRTLQFGVDNDRDEDDEEEEPEWEQEDGSDQAAGSGWDEADDGFRRTHRDWIGAQGKVQQIINEQEEAPECPSCREYMLEAGKHKIATGFFEPTLHPALGQSLLQPPFELKLYVCPSCFHTASQLSGNDREGMLRALASED
ncbi:hypothetical protein ABEW34_11005 [Paenibacillus algorifonticola]|uniref:hypothetical protein n=1 Tax=Paenibacillus algorifonticola TaxID=684063 RepID=UPI003D2AA381